MLFLITASPNELAVTTSWPAADSCVQLHYTTRVSAQGSPGCSPVPTEPLMGVKGSDP